MDQDEAPRTIATMLYQYNSLVEQEAIPRGLNYRVRRSFKDRDEAIRYLDQLHSSLRAVENGPLPEDNQVPGEQETEDMAAKKKSTSKKKTAAPRKSSGGKRNTKRDAYVLHVDLSQTKRKETTKGYKHLEKLAQYNGSTLGDVRHLSWFQKYRIGRDQKEGALVLEAPAE